MQSQTPKDSLIGAIVGERYRVLSALGEGGMARVYLAEDSRLEKRVALKVLRAESHTSDMVKRFKQEAISASRVDHPNVVKVFDVGQLKDGCEYLVMEFLNGNDLADELQRCKVLSALRALPIAFQICGALSAVHAGGVVHRDMKPENVFLKHTDNGEQIVKIVDFGIAQLKPSNAEAAAQSASRRLTRTGMIFGTPEYMAPEQARGEEADRRCDVYAVGIMLFRLLTGELPFTASTFVGTLQKHLDDVPPTMRSVCPDLQVSDALEAVVRRALAKDPSQRFQTMEHLAAALANTPEGRASRLRAPLGEMSEGTAGSPLPVAASPSTVDRTVVIRSNDPAAVSPSPSDRTAVTLSDDPTAMPSFKGTAGLPPPAAVAASSSPSDRTAVTLSDDPPAVRSVREVSQATAGSPPPTAVAASSSPVARTGVAIAGILGAFAIGLAVWQAVGAEVAQKDRNVSKLLMDSHGKQVATFASTTRPALAVDYAPPAIVQNGPSIPMVSASSSPALVTLKHSARKTKSPAAVSTPSARECCPFSLNPPNGSVAPAGSSAQQ